MSAELHAVWVDPDQAGQNFAHQVRPWCREQWKAGKRIAVTLRELEDERSLQQNAFYWAFVLKTVSQQATIEGIGADADGWHYYFKRRHLGYTVEKTRVPGSKRPVIRRVLRSTKKLKVKPFSKYLEEVMATAATEFGVTFEPGKRWEDWRV